MVLVLSLDSFFFLIILHLCNDDVLFGADCQVNSENASCVCTWSSPAESYLRHEDSLGSEIISEWVVEKYIFIFDL